MILPDLTAGCSMADMASLDDVEACWDELDGAGLTATRLPITYMNSTAALKAFCGERGGVVCTSSNARAVFGWAWAQKRRVLFFPDQHLGRVTGRALGVDPAQMPVWDSARVERQPGRERLCDAARQPRNPLERLLRRPPAFHRRARSTRRGRHAGIRVVVHPECRLEVVEAADSYGSTEHIIRVVGESPPGSRWAVGTEINLVAPARPRAS